MARSLRVRVLRNEVEVQNAVFAAGELVTIGRDTDNRLPLDEDFFSGRHGALSLEADGTIKYEDRRSTNGLYFGEELCKDGNSVTLASGQRLHLRDAVTGTLVELEVLVEEPVGDRAQQVLKVLCDGLAALASSHRALEGRLGIRIFHSDNALSRAEGGAAVLGYLRESRRDGQPVRDLKAFFDDLVGHQQRWLGAAQEAAWQTLAELDPSEVDKDLVAIKGRQAWRDYVERVQQLLTKHAAQAAFRSCFGASYEEAQQREESPDASRKG